MTSFNGRFAPTVFDDDVFRVQDQTDQTKKIAFQVSGVTTGTTRTITIPDSDVDLGAPAYFDDIRALFGTGGPAWLQWETADANANYFQIELPTGGGVDVPVIVIGQGLDGVDLGLFDGVLEPLVAFMAQGATDDGPDLRFYKTRGTLAAPTVITSGDSCLNIRGYGYSGAAGYVQAAAMQFDSEGTVATTRVPGAIRFRTATDASPSVLTTRLIIDSAGLATFANAVTIGGALTLETSGAYNDNVKAVFGGVASLQWETGDANANYLQVELPTGGGVDVPVIVIGQGLDGVDLGLYNGVVDPLVALMGAGAVTTAPVWDFRKARGTLGTPTIITSGDDLGSIRIFGYSGAAGYVQAAAIEFDSEGTVATTRVPGAIRFRTGTDAAPTVLTTRLTIDSAGLATFANAVTINGAVIINTPTITLSQDTNFALSGGVNGVSFDGTTLTVDGTNNRVGIGTASPGYQLHNYHAPTATSGEEVGAQFNTYPSLADTSTGTYNAMQGEIGLESIGVDITAVTVRGGRFTAYMNSAGKTVASAIGMLCGSNNYAGTTTTAISMQLGHAIVEGSIVTGIGLQVGSFDLLGAGTMTNQIGIAMPTMATATNNTNLLIGTTTAVAGNFSIYNVSSYSNYFAGLLWIGDTANANMQLGVTVNQGPADNQLIAGKSSDVAHGLTSGGSVNAETDDYVSIQKFSATLGGLLLASFQEDPAGAQVAMAIDAFGGQAATGPSTTNENLFIIRAAEHNAANALVDAPANSQIFGVQRRVSGAWNNAFIVDEDGDLFVDGNIVTTAFDEWDDVALVRAFDQSRSDQLIRSRWDDYVYYNQADLQRAGIISTPTDSGRAMVNVTQLQRLHNGAIWQLGMKAMSHEERIEYLEGDNKALRQELWALKGG